MLSMKDLSRDKRLKISNEYFSNKENGQQQRQQQPQQHQQQQVGVEKRRLPPTIDSTADQQVNKILVIFFKFRYYVPYNKICSLFTYTCFYCICVCHLPNVAIALQ